MSNPPVKAFQETAALYAVMEDRPEDLDRILDSMLDDELSSFQTRVDNLRLAILVERNKRRHRRLGAEPW